MNKLRRSFGGWVSVMLLVLLCTLILIPIVFTFLYSVFSKGEISAYLAQRGSYDDTAGWTFSSPLPRVPAAVHGGHPRRIVGSWHGGRRGGQYAALCIIEPVYVFPEWVPAALVEWEEIVAAFWQVWQPAATFLQLRTPKLLRLQYFKLNPRRTKTPPACRRCFL